MRPHSFWTDEQTEQLKQLASGSGLSGSKIAERMGLSRNSVLGKLFRLGINLNPSGLTLEEMERIRQARRKLKMERKRERERMARLKKKLGEGKMPAIYASKPKAKPVFRGALNIPFADLRPFSDLTSNQCRYVSAEPPGPDYLACGNVTETGKPYCPRCWDICHTVSNWPARRAAA